MGFALRLSSGFRARGAGLARSRRGGAAVEFAIIGPVLILLLSGIFTYGGYFLTAHAVQQMANDAARAAIAGLDDEERLTLAREMVRASIESQPYLRGDVADVELTRAGGVMTLRVTYDASEDLYWAFDSLTPAPAPRIARAVTIRTGGY